MSSSRKKANRAKASAAGTAVPKKGSQVQWKWGMGKAIGRVLRVFRERITRRIKGASITRNGTPSEPALLVKPSKGGEALKSASEVKPMKRATSQRRKAGPKR